MAPFEISQLAELKDATTQSASIPTGLVGNANGYVYEFGDVDVTLTTKEEYTVGDEDQFGEDVSAVAVLNYDISASALDSFIQITTDSDDLTDSDDISFSINKLQWQSVVYESATGNIPFSKALVEDSAIGVYNSPMVKNDLVRAHAKDITGGYSAADIFSNESALVSDVESADASLNAYIEAGLVSGNLNEEGNSETDLVNIAVRNLLNQIMADVGSGGRMEQLLQQLSTNSSDGSNQTTAYLKFEPGEVLSFRISYIPANVTPFTGAGSIDTRSYRVLLVLS